MSKGLFGSAPWASIIGICMLAGLKPAAMNQAPGAKPASTAQDVLPVYIEEFFLSEAVRSEEHGELQWTVDSMAFRGKGSAADGQSAELDIEYGITRRLQAGMETPYGIQSTAASELPVSWSTLSAAMGVNLPSTARGSTSYEPEVMAAKGFGKLQIHTSFIPELGGDDKSLEYNVASLRPFAHHLIPTLEFNGRRNSGVNSFYVTPGIYKHLPHRLEIGAAVPAGLRRFSSPVGVVVKMTWEIGGDDDD